MTKATNKIIIHTLFLLFLSTWASPPLFGLDQGPGVTPVVDICELAIDSLAVLPADCGEANGAVALFTSGGDPDFVVNYAGPVAGSFTSDDPVLTTDGLPAGVYAFQVTDAEGCVTGQRLIVPSDSDFSLAVAPVDAVCGEPGGALVALGNGTAPYEVLLAGPDTSSFSMPLDTFELDDLTAGDYLLVVSDAEGCVVVSAFAVEPSAGAFTFEVTTLPAPCDSLGALELSLEGTAPYTIQYNGPISGNLIVNNSTITIDALPIGIYELTVADAGDCTVSETAVVPNADLPLEAAATNGACGSPGSIALAIHGSAPPYIVQWTGLASGSTTTSEMTLTLDDLPAGTYVLTVTDADGCVAFEQQTLIDEVDELDVTVSALSGVCSATAGIQIEIANGEPAYTIEWSGPVSGSLTADSNSTEIGGLPAGDYTLTITDANGCSSEQEVSLTVTASDVTLFMVPINGPCNGLGAIWLDIEGGVAPFTISWAGPESGSLTTDEFGLAIPGLPTGLYVVTVTDANGCVGTGQIVINNQDSDLNIVLTVNGGTCQFPGYIHVDINQGSSPHIVSWSGPESGSLEVDASGYFIPQLTSGTYTITVTDENGCTTSGSATIINDGDLQLTAEPHPGICTQPGSITVTVGGGEGPYTYEWNGPASGSLDSPDASVELTGLPAGEYDILVTDATDCGTFIQVDLPSVGNIDLTATAHPGDCGQPGSITVEVTDGVAPYTYEWTGPVSGSTTANESLVSIGSLPSGTYEITATDGNGCEAVTTVTLTNQPGIVVTAVPYPGECGDPGVIFVDVTNGTAPYTYIWSGPVSGSTMTSEDWITVADLPSGTYTFVVTDANGCGDSVTVPLDNEPGPAVNVTADPGECGALGSIFINVTGGTTPYTYIWSGPVSGSTMTSNTQLSLNDLPSGTYTIVVTDANDCGESETVTLVNEPAPEVTAVPYPGECGEPGSIFVDIVNGPAPYTYVWSGPVSGSTITSEDWITIADLPSGTYTFTVTDANGCSDSVTVTLTNEPALDIDVTAHSGECGEPGEITVDVTSGTAPYTYVWSGPVSGSTTTGDAQLVLGDLPSGTYTIAVTDANDCGDSATVTLDNQPAPVVTAVPYPGECGEPGSIFVDIVNGPAPYTYVWTGPVSGSTTTSEDWITIADLPSGTYTIVVTDANGCSGTVTVTLTNEPAVEITVTANDGVCGGDNSIQITVNSGTPPFTYVWSGPESGSLVTSETSLALDDLTPGDYTIAVTDANDCGDSATVTVETVDLFTIVSLPEPGPCGQNGNIWIDFFNGTPPFTVTWTGPVSGSTTTTAFGINIGDLPGGVYTVVVTDNNGCEASEVVDLIIPPYDLDLTVTPNPGGCGANGSITVTVSGGAPDFNLSWSGLINGDTVTSGDTFVFDDLPDGTVTFQVTDANLCILSETVTLDNNAANPVVTLTPTSGTCGEDGSIQVHIANGTAPFTIVWSGPVSGSNMTSDHTFLLDDLPSGTYTVVVTDANACGDSASATIDNTGQAVTFTAVPSNGQCGEPGSIALEITNAVGPYTITWTGPVSGSLVTSVAWNTISDLPSGAYTIVVTGSDGCSASQVVMINNEEDVPVLTAEAINGICGQSGGIDVTISGGAPPYDLIWNGPVSGSQVITDSLFLIGSLPSGVYTVTVVDDNNCSAGTTVTIDNSDDNLNFTVQPVPGVCGENGSFVLTFEDGTAPYTVVWSGPVSGSNMTNDATYTIFNLPDGFYTIVVTDANGCGDSQLVELNNEPGLEAVVSVLDGACGVSGSIWITVLEGEAPFIIDWTGPVSGSDTTNLYEYDILDLPEGSYMVKVTDANGCMFVTTVFIVDYPNDLALSLTPNTGTCGDPGSIGVAVSGGLAPFEINWTGPATGSQTINGNMYTIAGLPAGSYTVSVVDANACVRTATAQLGDPGVAMDVTLTAVNADCENDAFIQVDISGGAPGYDISWTGPESDTVSTMSTSFTIDSLSAGTYTVTVADAAGCTIEQTAQITNDGQNTGADFSFSVNGLTVSFTNNSPNGTYAWTFGDGGSSTEANPVYTYDTEGTYEVCLTVDGNCGTSTLCQDVTVQAPPAPAMLMAGTAGGEDGEMVSVPVSIEGLDVLATVSGSIGLSDPSVATFMGIAPGVIQPAFNVNNGSFSYYDTNGVGIPLDDGAVLFYVQLQLHGSPGVSTEVFLGDDPLPVEVSSMINDVLTIVPHTTVSGQVSIEAVMSLISGEVQSLWGAGIPEVMVEVNGAGYQHYQMTDAAGHYGMAPAPMGHLYTVTPERNGNPSTGLSSYALYQGQRFLLGLPTPLIHSPYQVIAGDVNGNNLFNELDLLITQQVLLGINDGFPGGKVWQFVAAGQPMPVDFNAFNVFPYASAQSLMVMQDTTVNFVGVRSGDLLGEAVPGYAPDPSTESPEDLILEIGNQSVAAGEIIEIPVRSANFETIVSYQLGLLFDTHQLAFLGFEGGDADELHTVLAALSGAVTGELRLSWFHRQGQSATAGAGEPLFYLRFAALQDIDDWNGLLQVDPNGLPARAHNAAGMAMDIVLQVEGATSVGQPDAAAFRLYQNLPNPLRHSTVIPFDLPRAGEAELLIRDQYGRLVQLLEGDFAGGRNVFEVDGSALPAGVYYYTLRSGGFVETRSMVVL